MRKIYSISALALNYKVLVLAELCKAVGDKTLGVLPYDANKSALLEMEKNGAIIVDKLYLD